MSFNNNSNSALPSGDPQEDFEKAMTFALIYALVFIMGILVCGVLGLLYHLFFA